jgi:rubrerythrin
MADPDLYVDLDAMQELANQLGQIRAALMEAEAAVNTFDPRLGSERIEEALNDFVSGWKDGRKRIIEGVEALMGKCHGSIDTYLENERRVIKSTGKGP